MLALITARFLLLLFHTSSAQGQGSARQNSYKSLSQRWPMKSPHLWCAKDFLAFASCSEFGKHNTRKSACVLVLVRESMWLYCLRCKALFLGKPLEIHSIYLLILEQSLKQKIKDCEQIECCSKQFVAFGVELAAGKPRKNLGSVRRSLQDMFHPHNWKTWPNLQSSWIFKIMSKYQKNQ